MECVAQGAGASACAAAAAGATWLASGAGLLASTVALTPDLYRTLGFRTEGGKPRTALDVRFGFGQVRHPALASSDPSVALDRSQVAIGVGGEIALFDGFQLYPTLGGVLSADVLAGYTWIPWPTDQGYERASSYRTLGVRVGLLRESFSVPGIAATVAKSWGSTAIFAGDTAVVSLDPSATHLKLAVGKDLYGVGVHAAVGRNWSDADARIGGDFGQGQVLAGGKIDHARTTAQLGASLNFLVLRIQADVGWGLGAGGPETEQFAAEEGALFGAIAVRLIF